MNMNVRMKMIVTTEVFMQSSIAPRTRAKVALVVALFAVMTAAEAHTGHGASGFASGVEHPLGPDHLLAMVAVGIWSVFALPERTWMGPATFMLALVLSAALGASGFTVPHVEHAISASVVVFGLMLVGATRGLSIGRGLGLIAVAASLHGLAHGAEAPGSASFAGYAAGFLITTVLLHTVGVLSGLTLKRWLAARATPALAGVGITFSSAGIYLVSQL
jgi:urease accessory protein